MSQARRPPAPTSWLGQRAAFDRRAAHDYGRANRAGGKGLCPQTAEARGLPVALHPGFRARGFPPEQLVASILEKEHRIAEIMGNIKGLLAKHGA
jgi:hypothetical protein